jgi:putative drug exporter of the RND superfamily
MREAKMERQGTQHDQRSAGLFARLGRFVVTHPWRIIAAWVVAAVVLTAVVSPNGLVDPASVKSNDQENFLPAEDESARAHAIGADAFPEPDGATATLVVTRDDNGRLSAADTTRVEELTKRLEAADIPNVASVTSTASDVSPNRKVQLGTAVLTKQASDPTVPEAITELRADTERILAGSGLTALYGGEAAIVKDNEGVQALVTVGMVVVILLLLLAIFRSPIIAFVTVGVISLASGTVTALLVLAAKAFGFQIDDTVTGLLPVVIFGVGTDYVVFLVYRYRERLRSGEPPKEAMATSIAKVGEAITSSAFAVTVSLGALLLSTLGSFRVLGPALAGTVLVMLAVGLTLIPAVLVLMRGKVFWPAKAWREDRPGRIAGRIGAAVGQRPARMATFAIALLAALAIGAAGYKADYDQDQTQSGSESARALADMETGFPAGVLHPTNVLVKSADDKRLDRAALSGLADRLKNVSGVGQVLPAELNAGGDVAQIAVLLEDEPISEAAMNIVEDEIIPVAHAAAPPGATVRVGGDTATYADVKQAVNTDMKVVFPVAGLLIGLILMVMLRSLVAPLYLLAGVALGFAAALGASVLVFQGAAGEPGLMFSIPIIVYLFVASMGSDYAILMISRLREGISDGLPPREAARQAVVNAGPAVGAAGLILAGTFAALIASPLLSQTGFAVAIGVLLAAFVMAWVLVPSLTALLGRAAFWPGRTSRRPGDGDAVRRDEGLADRVPAKRSPAIAIAETR